MKTLFVVVLALSCVPIVAGGVWVFSRFKARDVTAERNSPYEGLRTQALAVSARDVGLTVGTNELWGALMDLPISDATATVVAFADGTTSIYLSSGGGFIGGGQRPVVRTAAEAFVKAAGVADGAFAPVASYPVPPPGRVRFYVHVGDGIRMAEAAEHDLQSGRHELSMVYAAGQAVITAYRESEP